MSQCPERGDLRQQPAPSDGSDLSECSVNHGNPGGQQQHEQQRVHRDQPGHGPEDVQHAGEPGDLLPRVIDQVEEDREDRAHPGCPGQQSAPGTQVPPAWLGGGSLCDGWHCSG